MTSHLTADEVGVGDVVYLINENGDRSMWCERTERGFTGGLLFIFDEGAAEEIVAPDGSHFVVEPKSWHYGRWMIVDTETTGLDSADDPCGIIELGAVIMQEGRVVTTRSGVFNPGKPIHPKASEVHGITDAMVAKQPRITDRHPKTGRTPAEGLDALCAEHDVVAIVGYNVIAFDLPIIRRELGARWCELESAVGLVVDPLVVVRLDAVGRFWPGKGRHKLTAVARRLGLDMPEPGLAQSTAHRAVWDCVLAGRVLWHLREHVPHSPLEVRKMMAEQAKAQQASFDSWRAKQPAADAEPQPNSPEDVGFTKKGAA